MNWTQWHDKWIHCTKCPIGGWAHRHVLGTGPNDSEILVVGEAPGRTEDVLGEPFVGRAGRLFNEMLREVGLERSKLFITNLVACRPCEDANALNRAPSELEVQKCSSRLEELLWLLKPKVILLVGRQAQQYGHELLLRVRWVGRVEHLVHPAALLRQGGRNAPGYAKALKTLVTVK